MKRWFSGLIVLMLLFVISVPAMAERDLRVKQIMYGSHRVAFVLTEDGTLFVWGNPYSSTSDQTGGSATPIVMARNVRELLGTDSYMIYYTDDNDDFLAWQYYSEADFTKTGKYHTYHYGTLAEDNYLPPFKIASGIKKLISCNNVYPNGYFIDADNRLCSFTLVEFVQSIPIGAKTEYVMNVEEGTELIQMGTYWYLWKQDGSLWVVGEDKYNCMGVGQKKVNEPTLVTENVQWVFPMNRQMYVGKDDHSLWAWGLNQSNYLGNCKGSTVKEPTKILDDALQIQNYQMGLFHDQTSEMYVIDSDGSIWNWQDGSLLLGFERKKPASVITKVMQGVGTIKIFDYRFFVTEDHKLYTYDRTKTSAKNPVVVPVFCLGNVDYVADPFSNPFKTDEGDLYVGMLDGTLYLAKNGDFNNLYPCSYTAADLQKITQPPFSTTALFTDEEGRLYALDSGTVSPVPKYDDLMVYEIPLTEYMNDYIDTGKYNPVSTAD